MTKRVAIIGASPQQVRTFAFTPVLNPTLTLTIPDRRFQPQHD